MIDSLFIVSSQGHFVVERHFRGNTPRHLCEPFMEKLRATDALEDIPAILCANRRHVLVHVLREKMVYLAVVTQEEPPLAVLELLDCVHKVLVRYLGEVTEDMLRQNFSTVYLLLDEMIDSGLPFTMELNSLESIIAPPSTFNKALSVVTGSSAQVLSDVPPDQVKGAASEYSTWITNAVGLGTQTYIGGASSEVWWRRQNVSYASNEVYIDIVESINCICDGNGQMVSGGIAGDILVNSKLSGLPDVLLTLRNPGILQNVSFHPCVRLHRFERDKALSFVPPDGEFTLASYWMPDTTVALPFHFTVSIQWHAEHGKLQIAAAPKLAVTMQHKQMLIDKFCVNVRLPSSIASTNVACQGGSIRFDEASKVVVWQIGKLATQENKAECTLLYSTDPKTGAPIIPSEERCTAQLAFVVKGWAISGIKLDACDVSGTSYTPYKASRYTTTSGKMDFRVA